MIRLVVHHGIGRPIKRMHFAGPFVIPSMGRIFACEGLVHGLEGISSTVKHTRLHDDRSIATVDGRVVVFVLMREIAPRHELAMALAIVLQADVHAHTPVQAEIRIGMVGAFVQPGHEIVIGFDFLIALHGATEPQRLDPITTEVFQDRPRARYIRKSRCAHDATRHHVGRMRPLTTQQRIDFHRSTGDGHALFVGCPGKR